MRKIFLPLFLLWVSLPCRAQDPVFTQFTEQALYLNPAYAGANRAQRVVMAHRNRHINRKAGGSHTTVSSYDLFLANALGGGVMIAHDQQVGNNRQQRLSKTSYNFMLSYEAALSSNLRLRFGAQSGITQRGLNYDNIILGTDLRNDPQQDPLLANGRNVIYYPELALGVLLGTESFTLGIAADHITEPDAYSLTSAQDVRLSRKYTVHAQKSFQLPNSLGSWEVQLLYQHQEPFDHFIIGGKKYFGLNYAAAGRYEVYDLIYLGSWLKSMQYGGQSAGEADAVSFGGGYILHQELNILKVGLNYDLTVSTQGLNNTGGSLGFSVSYAFKSGSKKARFDPDEPVNLFNRKGRCQDHYLWTNRKNNSLMLVPRSSKKRKPKAIKPKR